MKIQIAKAFFLMSLSVMKKILDLGEFKLGKQTPDYKYFKKQVFDYHYIDMLKLFKKFKEQKILKICPKKCSLRQGYSNCDCGGSGYINV